MIKKFMIVLVGIFLVASMFFTSCGSDSEDSNSPEVTPGTIGEAPATLVAASTEANSIDSDGNDVILFYYRQDEAYSKWGLWLWPTGTTEGEAGYNLTIGKATTFTSNGLKIAYWNISSLVNSNTSLSNTISNKLDLNFIIRDDGWNKDPGVDQCMTLSSGKHFMVLSGDSTVYAVSENFAPTISSANTISTTELQVTLNVNYALQTFADNNGFSVSTADGTLKIDVTDVKTYEYKDSGNRNHNYSNSLYMVLASNIDTSKDWYLKNTSFKPDSGTKISLIGAIKSAYKDYVYNGDDLGLTINADGTANFKTWAPMASDVKLLLFNSSLSLENPDTNPVVMNSDEYGIWSVSNVNISSYKYYKFRITNSGVSNDVCDIYAKSASADSVASQIVDINTDTNAMPDSWETTYTNPWSGSTYSDAVIYEMHIRDWSRPVVSTSTGKFLDIANGTKVIAHLQALGITHVQLLPCFDYAEKNSNTEYNWGYNPYHYNVPEGRYVTEGYTDGTQAVKEFRTLIKKLHEAGIAVNMDVVYNHTSGTGTGSLYDMTVPYYYYNIDSDGNYINGSGCGNEIDSGAPMVKKYIIDSLKHWMTEYHINGFRFDLMGCLEKSTMKDIYDSLHEIDPKVMIYGEPWTGGTSGASDGAVTADVASSGLGVGAFDDDYRNAIKGAEFGGFKSGHVQGTFADTAIITGLTGASTTRNKTGKPGLSLHYVECHDNYTLFDKLAMSYLKVTESTGDLFNKIKADGLAEVKKQDTLAAALVLLSQGTPFINGGQEFLRTKRGDENSYKSPDGINQINLDFASTYSDVYNTYKGLIALRKANPTAFGSNSTAKATKPDNGITKYTTGDFLVYFNATSDESDVITTTGYSKVVDVTSGTPTESTTLPTITVPAKSFVILKK